MGENKTGYGVMHTLSETAEPKYMGDGCPNKRSIKEKRMDLETERLIDEFRSKMEAIVFLKDGTPMRTIVNRPSRSDSADLGSK